MLRQCARRQTLGVVGESGSGKTTLGLALLRLIGPGARSSMARQPHDGMKRDRTCGPLRTRDADRLPGPYRLPVAAHVVAPDRRRRTAHRARRRATDRQRTKRVAPLEEVGLDPQPRWIATRTSSRAANASASPLPAPWSWSQSSSCWMNRPARSTCRCRRKSSICSANCNQDPPPRLPVHQPRSEGGACARQRRHRHARRQWWWSKARHDRFDKPETDYTRALLAAASI